MKNDATRNPGGLPLFPAGVGAANVNFSTDGPFWDQVNRFISESQLTEHLDVAMAGRSSPRVWLFLHEPGESRLSVAAALHFARELSRRDQAVLLLDGDDEEAELTRWAGRQESDGWIDLIRYGASVLSCGDPLPFEGRRGYLLGVGSFAPAEATGPEILELLGRLKRQADDILISAPANQVGRHWAAGSDLILVCWDRAHRSAGLVDNLLASFQSVGVSVGGLLAYGLPNADAVADLLGDSVDRAEIGADGPVSGEVSEIIDGVLVEAASEDDQQDISESIDSEVVDSEVEVSGLGEVEVEVSAGGDVLPESEGFPEIPAFGELYESNEGLGQRGNSGVFWLVAVVSLVMVLVAGTYYYKFVRIPPEGNFPVVVQETGLAERSARVVPEGQEAAGVLQEIAHLGETKGEEGLLAEDISDPKMVEEEGQTVGLVDSTGVLAQARDDQIKDDRETEAIEDPDEAQRETQRQEADLAVDTLAENPFARPVGSDGWALHVYSFPDSALAVREQKVLLAKGFKSMRRVVQIKNKGRWHRLYLGSFKTRAEAKAARPHLMEKLKQDWANPVRF